MVDDIRRRAERAGDAVAAARDNAVEAMAGARENADRKSVV